VVYRGGEIVIIKSYEMVHLMMWYAVFKDSVRGTINDKKLFDKIRETYNAEKGIKTQEVSWTDRPRYQPGEDQDVEIRVCTKNEGGTP
jgi:hypothetical protein